MADLISCNVHDHFEIVCMRRSQVIVRTKDEQSHQGEASNIIQQEGREFLVIQSGEKSTEIELTQIIQLEIPAEQKVIDVNA